MKTIIEVACVMAAIWMVVIILIAMSVATISFAMDVIEDLRRRLKK